MKNKLGYVSNVLTAFRAAIAPCLIWDAKDGFFVSQYQFFYFAVIFGIFSNIEDIVITAIMPYWKCDILDIKSARNLRRAYKGGFC